MTPLFPARRSAERFDALVEGARHDADASTAELLELVGALRSTPVPQARPEFVTGLREQLMVAARSELVAPAAGSRDEVTTRLTIAPRRTRRERRVGIALGAVAIIGATTSMAVASQSAIPGDALYPVKRAIENTHTGFSVGDDAKGETLLGNASGRLDEVNRLTQQSDPDATLVTNTLNTFSDQATEAGDLLLNDYEQHGDEGSIVALQDFTADSMNVLAGLQPTIPTAAEDALKDAAKAVFLIDQAADQVCPDCAAGILETPPQLVAGGTTAVDDASQALADGPLPGTVKPSDDASHFQGDVKGGDPSGLTPPDSPVSIPPVTVDPSDPTGGATDATGGLGVPLPSANTNTNGGNGGHGKPKPTTPVDLTPVTDSVTEVVNGVVNGVNGLLSGLTGQTGTGLPGQ